MTHGNADLDNNDPFKTSNPDSSQLGSTGTTTTPPSHSVIPAQTHYYEAPPSGMRVETTHTGARKAQTAQTKNATSKKPFFQGFLGALLSCVLAFSGFGAYQWATGGTNTGTGDKAAASISLGASSSTDIVQVSEDTTLPEVVAEKALPSVVSIYVYTRQSTQGFGSLYGFGQSDSTSSSGELVQSAMGSGVILSEDGYVVTNFHVVDGAEKIEVSVEGASERLVATLVGADESSDIAVIKIENASGLTPIEIGSSSDLSVGEWVMALGSPYGLEQSVSTGIVSAVSRSYAMQSSSSVTLYADLIQTDAAINQGNSGGALVDSDGKLIGINTLISSSSGDNSGVGFAIPVDYVMGIAKDLVNGKTPSHAQLGVSLSSVTSSTATRYNLSASGGAYVEEVTEGGAAKQAGIQAGDVITKFNGTSITSTSELMLAIRSASPGDTVKVEVNRSGKTLDISVTLGSDAS